MIHAIDPVVLLAICYYFLPCGLDLTVLALVFVMSAAITHYRG